MNITHRLVVSGTEIIAVDNLAGVKRYAEERFRKLRHGMAIIKWEDQADGSTLLTWKLPAQPGADFYTSNYKIVEAGA